MTALFAEFARINDAVTANSARLQKQAILAAYFRALEDDDLRRAVRYCAGRTFAATDERVLAVGGAIVWKVILELLEIDPADLRQRSIAAGELGEAIAPIWPSKTIDSPLTLADLAAAFDQIAATGTVARKRAILLRLFHRCQTGRDAACLTKIIFGDMRTGAQEGVLQAAVASAFDKPLKAIQRSQLLVGDLGDVAFLAKHDRLAEARFTLFHPIQFMLATPVEDAADAAAATAGRNFIAEDKLDGIRAQVHKSARRAAIYTRTMDRADAAFPEIVHAALDLPGEFLLDGEIVPMLGDAIGPFAHLQRRMGRKKPPAAILAKYPVAFIAFDLLYADGELLMEKLLRERQSHLDRLLSLRRSVASSLRRFTSTPVTCAEDVARAFDSAKSRRNEGLVLKDLDSIYSPGRRGQMWFKLKTHLPTLDCVVTAAEYGHGKRRQSLSDYTFAVWDNDRLVNIGKAFSGVTDEEIKQLTELFLSISHANNGHTFLVPPKVVLEIAFDQIQKSDRHESGYAFRFPRIKRIRWDKLPQDADTIARVTEIFASAANTSRDATALDEPPAPPEPTLFDHLD